MDPYNSKGVLWRKLRSLDPENASIIMAFLFLQGLDDSDLLRLAFGPEVLLYNVIINAKTELGFFTNSLSSSTSSSSSSSAPSSPSPLKPVSKPCNGNDPFSQSSPRVTGSGSFAELGKNQSPQSTILSGSLNNGNGNSSSNSSLNPNASPFLSHDNIPSGSAVVPPCSKNGNDGDSSDSGGANGDSFDESQLDEYFSFLADSSSRNEELLELKSQLSGYSGNNGDFYSHKRRLSAGDASFSTEEDEGRLGIGYRPCMYFAKGFCKKGVNCKFVHGGFDRDNAVEVNGGVVGVSHREMKGLFLQQQHEDMLRMKATQVKQRLAYSKYMNFLLQQRNEPRRLGAAAIMGDEFHKFGQYHPEMNDLLAIRMAEKANLAARQIFLTFPSDSTFKDEDISNYFSIFGPVEDVRIPYQYKRMFGFVTFVYPETVQIILACGNPHFICDSRVLVKPYKEKGKVTNERQQHLLQQQLLKRKNFSPFSNPSGLDRRELYDLHLGTRLPYINQEMMLRRKLEEQAELQQAIELQGRGLINLQLPDIQGDFNHCHQCSLSVGAPISLPTQSPANHNVFLNSDGKNQEVQGNHDNLAAAYTWIFASAEKNFQQMNASCNQKSNTLNGELRGFISETCDAYECHEGNVEYALPDSLFSSPANSSGNQQPAFSSDSTEIKDTSELSVPLSSENELSISSTPTDNGPS